MILDLWAYRVERFGPSFTEFKCLSYLYSRFENLGSLIVLRSILRYLSKVYCTESTKKGTKQVFSFQQKLSYFFYKISEQ